MALPPLWKIKRELLRLAGPFSLALRRPVERLLTLHYDRNFGRRVTVSTQKLPSTGKVAVFILFQPHGIAESTFLTLKHLRQNEYQPIVVCNGPHLKDDVVRLATLADAVVERANVGYDFGAYRDGQKVMGDDVHRLERLVIMNDSTWFPLHTDDDTIARMEQSDADMIGHIFKMESAEKRGRDHVESHFLMFNAVALSSTAYRDFWRNYAMSNQRATTIRYGEKKLTQTMMKSGFNCRGLLSREVLLSHLKGLDEDALKQYAYSVIHHKKDAARYFDDFLERWDDPSARAEFVEWVSASLKASRQYLIATTFIETAMRLGGMGFVKKGKASHFHRARVRVLALNDVGVIPKIDPIIEAEIRAAVAEGDI